MLERFNVIDHPTHWQTTGGNGYMEHSEHLGVTKPSKESKSFSTYFEEHAWDDPNARIPGEVNSFSTGSMNGSSTTTADWMKTFEDLCKLVAIGAGYLSEKFKERRTKRAYLRKYKGN